MFTVEEIGPEKVCNFVFKGACIKPLPSLERWSWRLLAVVGVSAQPEKVSQHLVLEGGSVKL